jgi:hypothetical protein
MQKLSKSINNQLIINKLKNAAQIYTQDNMQPQKNFFYQLEVVDKGKAMELTNIQMES